MARCLQLALGDSGPMCELDQGHDGSHKFPPVGGVQTSARQPGDSRRRNLIVRELCKASSAMQAAYEYARELGDLELKQRLFDQGKEIASAIGDAQKTPEQRRAVS